MHRSNPSRGKVLFEVLCALGMSASFAGAWMQTHATALLGAAGIAALYGLLHLFDVRRPKEAAAAEPQRIDFEPATSEIVVPMVAPDEQRSEDNVAEVAESVEPATSRAGSGRRTAGSRKGSGRRTKAPKAAKAAEPVPAEEIQAPWPMAEEPEVQESSAPVDEEFVFSPDDEPSQSHIAPLFEPEPFARMQRRAFGRRGRL